MESAIGEPSFFGGHNQLHLIEITDDLDPASLIFLNHELLDVDLHFEAGIPAIDACSIEHGRLDPNPSLADLPLLGAIDDSGLGHNDWWQGSSLSHSHSTSSDKLRFENSALIISNIDTLSLYTHLDRVNDSLDENGLSSTTIVGATIATAALSVGYVIWTTRSSYLVSSLLAVTPAWSQVDPLPILEFAEANEELQDGDRPILDLVRLFDRAI